MRRRDEQIEVRQGRIGEGIAGLEDPAAPHLAEGPSQFLWRDRLWRVLLVQDRWVESGPWWDSPQVRAARGEWEQERPAWQLDFTGTEGAGDPAGLPEGAARVADEDLLCEQEVWRVEAACGRMFSRGVYELVHALGSESWRLRAVVD